MTTLKCQDIIKRAELESLWNGKNATFLKRSYSKHLVITQAGKLISDERENNDKKIKIKSTWHRLNRSAAILSFVFQTSVGKKEIVYCAATFDPLWQDNKLHGHVER